MKYRWQEQLDTMKARYEEQNTMNQILQKQLDAESAQLAMCMEILRNQDIQ